MLNINCKLYFMDGLTGIVYFGMREVIQMLSLITLDTFNAWYGDLGNGLDVSLIAVTLACSFIMEATNARTEEEMETVQIFFSVAIFIMWMSVLSFLKSTLIDFAVFVGGVFYVGMYMLESQCGLIFTLVHGPLEEMILCVCMRHYFTHTFIIRQQSNYNRTKACCVHHVVGDYSTCIFSNVCDDISEY